MKIIFLALATLFALGNVNVAAATGVSTTTSDKNEFSMQSQIIVKNIQHDGDENYVQAMNDAFVQAFNAVHPKEGFTMNKVQVDKEIDAPEDNEPSAIGVMLGEDKQTFLKGAKRYTGYYWSQIYYGGPCKSSCNEDNEKWYYGNYPPILSFLQVHPGSQQEFEETFCQLLRDSGLSTFMYASDCKILYLHKPHDKPVTTEE